VPSALERLRPPHVRCLIALSQEGQPVDLPYYTRSWGYFAPDLAIYQELLQLPPTGSCWVPEDGKSWTDGQ